MNDHGDDDDDDEEEEEEAEADEVEIVSLPVAEPQQLHERMVG
jgi:hypothetical protein